MAPAETASAATGFVRPAASDLVRRTAAVDPPAPRMLELDALRGLAALYVMLFHYVNDSAHLFPSLSARGLELPVSSQFAVHLFFLISGFVITLTLNGSDLVKSFALNRIARLFPAYLFAVTLTTGVAVAFRAYDPQAPITLWQYLANLTMLQLYLGDVPHVDGAYWSLMVEVTFYVWMALLFAASMLGRIERVAWLWLGLCFAVHAFELERGVAFSGPVMTAGLFVWVPLLFSGVMFYRVHSGVATWRTHGLIAACYLAYVVLLVEPNLKFGVRHLLVTTGIYALFYLFVYGRLGWLATRPLIFLGTISYSLYIVHHRIGVIAMNALQSELALPWFVVIPLACLLALGLATAITYGIERPANRALRRRWQPRRARALR